MDSKLKIAIGKAKRFAQDCKQEVVIVKSINGYRHTLKKFQKGNKHEASLLFDGKKIIVRDEKGKEIEKLDPIQEKATKKADNKTASVKEKTEDSQDKGQK